MRSLRACEVEPGMQIAEWVRNPVHGPVRTVSAAGVMERNEWLTVFVRFTDGSEASYSYDQQVAVA